MNYNNKANPVKTIIFLWISLFKFILITKEDRNKAENLEIFKS